LVEKYANVLNINLQLQLLAMELFASTDTEVDLKEKENSYPQYYKIVQLALTLYLRVPQPLREAFQQCIEYRIDCDPPWDSRVLTDLENLENSGNLSTLEKSGKIQGILG